jgi:hypothetical protein
MKIQLREGQEIVSKDGSIYETQKGDFIIESHGSDLPNVDAYSEPLSIKGKGIERVTMDSRDSHVVLFNDGLLCGFSWFGQISIANDIEVFKKKFSRVKYDGLSLFMNSRPATMFVELYGKEGEQLLDEAIAIYEANA